MFRGIYTGASAMLVQEKMLDVVGNNLANVDTAGFRARVGVTKSFPEVLMDRIERYTIVDEAYNEELEDRRFHPFIKGRLPIGTMPLANVLNETTMSLQLGNVQVTDRPLDVMINGEGFFVVEDGAGNTFYTRSGHFQRSADGMLVTHNGEFVLGDGGRVELGESDSYFVATDGQIYVDNEAVAQLQVVTFNNPTYLQHVGNSLLTANGDSGAAAPVEAPLVEGGALEHSNVEVVLEMVRMIEAQRIYEGAAKAVTTQDELTSRMITSLGKPA